MIRIMIENGETFIWIFGFALKTGEIGCSLVNCNKLRCEMVTLKAWVTSLIKWGLLSCPQVISSH